jgi:hypothetical protein
MRNAYLLSCDFNSERTVFSKKVLESIGFNVVLCKAIEHKIPLLSHKISMIKIYETIANDEHNEWSYIFEDDINLLSDINILEIIQYENISDKFFYLGICKYGHNTLCNTHIKINEHDVFSVSNFVRGLHAVAFSRQSMIDFLNFMKSRNNNYIDMILEEYTIKNRANIVRADLESYIPGHYGVFFQDRNKFETSIK